MANPMKPGGGNKPQPYVPAGNGDESGEYTTKEGGAGTALKKPSPKPTPKKRVTHCLIRNVEMAYNFRKSKLVGKVAIVHRWGSGSSVPMEFKRNSVIKKIVDGYVVSERYYNNEGKAYLDIDYTCHGNPKTHPNVPHIHRWVKDESGILRRGKQEDFQ